MKLRFRLHALLSAFISFSIYLSSSVHVFGQQLPLFTQYSQYHSFINPASISNEYWAYGYNLQVSGSYRNQWANHKYSPRTSFFKADYITAKDDDSALLLGAQFLSDETGATGFNGIYSRVGAVIGDLKNWGISGGITVGWVQHQFNTSEVVFLEAGDVNAGQQLSQGVMDIGGGVYFYKNLGDSANVNTFYAGISVPQLGFDVNYGTGNELFSFDRERHYFAVLGYFKEFEDAGHLEINAWGKYIPNVPTNFDLNVRYQFKAPFWIGIGGSTAKFAHFEAGVALRDLLVKQGSVVKVGYSMDRFFNTVGPDFGSTHEFNVAVLFNTKAKNAAQKQAITKKPEDQSPLNDTEAPPEKEEVKPGKKPKKNSKKNSKKNTNKKPAKDKKKDSKQKKTKQERKQEKINKRRGKLG